MGIFWRSAMPLLPTLAALVIIVNSAEEDLESEYRHDLRPRILDTGTPSYDQPWRAMEADPPAQHSRATDNWENNSPDEYPKRRRSGRKRKRRPQTASIEEIAPQERFAYPEDPPRPYFDVDFENTRQTTEIPKRRRKKPESRPIRWTDDVLDEERPLRRRGQRRKRPSLDTWPELAEFRQTAIIKHGQAETTTESIDQINIDDIRQERPREDVIQVYDKEHELTAQSTSNLKINFNQQEPAAEFPLPQQKPVAEFSLPLPLNEADENVEPKIAHMVEDKSLSEFSSETIITEPRPVKAEVTEPEFNISSPIFKRFDKAQDKCKSKYCKNKGIRNFISLVYQFDKYDIDVRYIPVLFTAEHLKSYDKIEEVVDSTKVREYNKVNSNETVSKCKDKLQAIRTVRLQGLPPITMGVWMEGFDMDSYLMDPLTLKDILKRSNGTSLSEILQQHNLSLTDLLRGKQHAVSIFKSKDSLEIPNRNLYQSRNELPETRQDLQTKEESDEKIENSTTEDIQTEVIKNHDDNDEKLTTTAKPVEDVTPKISNMRRRFPTGMRKKLRMRPMLNSTYKSQLSRDLITLNARKYSHHRRNATKSKEWKEVIPHMKHNITQSQRNITLNHETTTIAIVPEETTITIEIINNGSSSEESKPEDEMNKSNLDDINMDTTDPPEIATEEASTEIPYKIPSEKPVTSMVRPTVNSSGLRRQAFNNRLKRKRLKHKNATTEPPQDDILKHLFGLGTLVSSSEFIAKTEEPKTTDNDSKDLTTLDDFMTTESTRRTESSPIKTLLFTTKNFKNTISIPSTTEETAKIEIEEILNDTRTSAKLSKILMERNMTLSELVEHRERGSSHVHLADIFHNASREPNPPEPFLSKSLIEPISKETYPLRALLDANLHDPNARSATIDSSMLSNINIPVVMDFRNNVNENAENMGIMSLFNNFTKPTNKSTAMKDAESSPTDIDVRNISTTTETVRESRVFSENQDDIVSWNEIFSLMGRNHNNDTSLNVPEGLSPTNTFKKIRLDEDSDGDGLIVLEDLQHLKDFESNIASGSDEKIDFNAYDSKEPGILDKIPSQTKSVTVATASIAGLAMILFLLTYAAFKWKQQRSVIRQKRSFGDEGIPTPVFENRKGHKHNSSTRSISPMLQTSNIYTLNTLDSQNGKDSPDYMWDTLRKPFQ